METTVGMRIRELRKHYNLGVKEFASRCNLSHVAIFHLENGRTRKPHKSSLQRIASIYGSTIDWLLFGKHDMLPNGPRDLSEDENLDGYWKDEAYQEIKARNATLEKELERLWQIVGHFTNQSKADYRMLDAG